MALGDCDGALQPLDDLGEGVPDLGLLLEIALEGGENARIEKIVVRHDGGTVGRKKVSGRVLVGEELVFVLEVVTI